jgi:hypothetical protein
MTRVYTNVIVALNVAVARFRTALRRRVVTNRQAWAVLQQNAVTEQSELQLEFFYNAPSRAAAEKLRALIQEKKRYEVRVVSLHSIDRAQWRVEGRTQMTTMSALRLERWVTWMVVAGNQCLCDLYRWGTTIPNFKAANSALESTRSGRIQ